MAELADFLNEAYHKQEKIIKACCLEELSSEDLEELDCWKFHGVYLISHSLFNGSWENPVGLMVKP